MESCARVIRLFPEYAEGDLAPLDRDRVALHLRQCGPCTLRVKRHREFLSALEQLPQVVPPDHFHESIMAQVAADPLPRPHSRGSHLRLIKGAFWVSLAWTSGAAGVAGARLLRNGFAGRIQPLDPSVYAEWIESLGRFVFSFLLEITTRARVAGVLSSPHGLFAWGGLLSTLLATVLAAGMVGLGLLATARVLLGNRGR